ncbi:MAG: nitroreductase family protein [Firmicutes bacterium]|nr:nitroreductase family protein [Bacillota bacterium]
MEFKEVIKGRRSIRKFTGEPVPREAIMNMVDAARFAPSWKNTQVVRYHIVEDPEVIAKLATGPVVYNFEYNIKTLARATAVAIQTYKVGRSGYEKDGSFSTPEGDKWQAYDAGLSAAHFCDAAYEEGVGTVILGYYDDAEIRKIVDLPENEHVSSVICMGIPAIEPEMPPRKEVEDLVSFI